jgi:hypothetical protein
LFLWLLFLTLILNRVSWYALISRGVKWLKGST